MYNLCSSPTLCYSYPTLNSVMGILTYGFAFVGSGAFMAFSLHAYNTGKPETRSGDYFGPRLRFYSIILAFAGFLQLVLGIFCAKKGGMNVLTEGPITAAFLIVTYPVIAIFVGLIQVINGGCGVARSMGFLANNPAAIAIYPMSLAFQWFCVLSLQVLAQIGYLPGGDMAPAAPMVVAMSLGLSLMPAYLDHKMRTLPQSFPEDYYYTEVEASRLHSYATKQEESPLDISTRMHV